MGKFDYSPNIDEVFIIDPQIPIQVDCAENVRDVGYASDIVARRLRADSEYSVKSRIQPNALFRSAHLSSLTPKGGKTLEDLGITTVIDFRSIFEIEENGGEDKLPDSIEYVVLPIQAVVEEEVERDAEEISQSDFGAYAFWSMKNLYRRFIEQEQMRRGFGKALEIVAESDISLIHCRSGKDRTGWFIALCQHIAGTSPEVTMEEYLLSKSAAQNKAKYLAKQYKESNWQQFMPFASVYSEYLTEAVLCMEKDFGTFDEYIEACGVTSETIKKLQQKFVMGG